MANEFRLFEPIVVGSLASDPVTGYNGELYYNSTSNSFRIYQNGTWQGITAGSGTVTSVSVVSTNGFAGTVANASTTPAITMETTITGILQGNGTAISAASTTGSGAVVLATSPTLVTPALGTPSALVGTNISGTASSLTAGNINATSNSTLTTLSSLSLPYSQVTGAPAAITALTGDATASGPGSAALTLATVNSDTGTFGDASDIPVITVNGKGLITAITTDAVVAPAGTLSGTTLKSTVVTSSLTSLGTQSQVLNMGSNQINDLASPSVSTDAATKGYVDAAIDGLTWKGPVQAYANSNVPLSGSPSTNTLTIDSYSVQNGDVVILANQTTTSQQGVYVASGIGGTFYLLTAVTGYEAPTAAGDAYLVLNGTNYSNTAFVVTALSPITFVQFAGPNSLSFTAPLALSGSTVSLDYSNGLTVTGGNLEVLASDASILVASGGISVQEDPAGAISTDGSGIKVNVDGTTIDISSNNLEVKDNGISNAKLAQMPTDTLKGNNTGGTANAADLTVSQVTAMIGVESATASSLMERDSSGNSYQNQMNAVASSGPQERLSDDGTNFLERQYVDSITLTASSGPSNVDASLSFLVASYGALEAKYYLNDGTNIRMGNLLAVANSGPLQSLVDTATDTADMGLLFSLTNDGTTASIQYTSTNVTNITMRVEITRFRA